MILRHLEQGWTVAKRVLLRSGSDRLALARDVNTSAIMKLDDLLQRYFGTSDLSEASPAVQEAGVDRLSVDLGLEQDRARRFALWSLLHMLGRAPDLDVVFSEEADREAARNLMDLLATSNDC